MRQKIKSKSLNNSVTSISDSKYLIENNYNKVNRKNKKKIPLKRDGYCSEAFNGYKQKINKNIEFLQEEELQKIKNDHINANIDNKGLKNNLDINNLEESNQKFIDDNFSNISYDDYNEDNNKDNDNNDDKNNSNIDNVINDTVINNNNSTNEISIGTLLQDDKEEEKIENNDKSIINEITSLNSNTEISDSKGLYCLI